MVNDAVPRLILELGVGCVVVCLFFSTLSIFSHLRAYQRPLLQRHLLKILLMLPLYSLSSFAALKWNNFADIADVLRGCYEALVILCFFQYLVTLLGGERKLLLSLIGQPSVSQPFPVSLMIAKLDLSDPFVLLNLKRGMLRAFFLRRKGHFIRLIMYR